jgi:two-component system cell cycle sensor histidine kinase/response regulator CckA
MARLLANLRLRSKFLLSLVLVTTGLTCAALLVVHHTAKEQMQREVEEDAHNAILTFQVVQREHQVALGHKADLLATLAQLRNGDVSAVQDSSADPWQSEDCNLFALADADGKITALNTATSDFPVVTAQAMLRRSRTEHTTAGWWYGGQHLYQVAIQPIHNAEPGENAHVGTVVVGRELDQKEADDLRGISSTQVLFRVGGQVAVSTFAPLQEYELTQQLGNGTSAKQVHIDGQWYWADSVELTPGAHPAVTLTVLKSYDGAMAFLNRLNRLLLALGLIASLSGGALVFVISDAYTQPLASLAEGVRALEQGNFEYPLEAEGEDEVAQLTRAFDRMRQSKRSNEVKKQQLEDQLRQAQKMEAMGRLAGGVAHDFNNLLTVVKGHSDLLLSGLQETDPLYQSGQQISKAADRAASLTRQLLAFSRLQVLQPKVVDLNALVADMGKLLTRLIREDIAFTFRPGESLSRVKADPGQIEQVILNLTVNACDAMPHGGNLTIETRNVIVDAHAAQSRSPMPPGEYVLLTVTDNGLGMDANTKARIFEPFFTTKELGKGTGLGLATVYGVVKQSGGFIWVTSEVGKGTRFEIYLPPTREPAEKPKTVTAAANPVRRHGTVLLVEDEAVVRELACEFLKSAGYTVLAAADGVEALAVVNKWDAPIHVLLTDVVMPNMRGPELAKRLKRSRPEIKIVYMSGYSEYDRGNKEFVAGSFFLQKPYSREALLGKLDEAREQPTNNTAIGAGQSTPIKS